MCFAIFVTSCTATTIEGSRHQLYDSIGALSADSSAIIVGTISSQEIVNSEVPFTVSTVSVERSFSTPALANNLDITVEKLALDQTIEVRQVGSTEIDSVPAPILATGVTYLLFLAPTMLPEGQEQNQYYVTGGNAGIYQTNGSGYIRLVDDSGDTLPSRLAVSDLE